MGVGCKSEPWATFDDIYFSHDVDEYINDFTYDDEFMPFFDEAIYNTEPQVERFAIQDNGANEAQFHIPDSAIDPRLRGDPDVLPQDAIFDDPPQPNFTQDPNFAIRKSKAASSAACIFSRKLLRKSKKEESTYDHSIEAKYSLSDPRLYEEARRHSVPFRCAPPTFTQTPGYTTQLIAAPGLFSANDQIVDDGSYFADVSQEDIDGFLSSLNPEFLSTSMDDVLQMDSIPDVTESQHISYSSPNLNVIDQKEFTWRMLAPSAPPIQPSEKRKRGRPKKDEVEESHSNSIIRQTPPMTPFQPQVALQTSFSNTPQLHAYQQSNISPLYLPRAPITPSIPDPMTPKSALTSGSEGDDEGDQPAKRRKLASNGVFRSMSKKEQAYLEMDKKVQLYDETNINELLYFPKLRPGRTPCFWIQRHPYANTRIYGDHYRTWCRYRHCKGVDTNELIRTANGEMKEKNYKHPRTIIAGNYQIAVDWNYVDDETNTFKNDPEGQHAYDKRNVYDTMECFFHLRCFEQLTNLPQLVRQQLVEIDHRVLNKDKSRNKITKRKNKGGTNAAEIEWYLKDEAGQWMQRVRMDWGFNPLPGDDESLERVLLSGKKRYNEKKGMNKLGFGAGKSPMDTPDLDFLAM
ncbi:hypothetical protein ABW20_dc0107589 [Dactylellina cionopaga]|nr:hypothetical protein ABW20_dc0107589 [Dactylellina cionopaga]